MVENSRRFSPPIITLTTDFGEKDGYVGAMRGVMLTICPTATLTNLSHAIPPQSIRTAAFVLYQAFSYFPAQAVHCVVVDPGVGSQRRAIAIQTSHGIFVGPDNGVFSLVLTAGQVDILEAVTLTNGTYQLPGVSATFHGRDVFAPAAAHIAQGVPLNKFGPPVTDLAQLEFGSRIRSGAPGDETSIIHIDRFGNLILSVTAQEIDNVEQVIFAVADQAVKSLSRTFSDVKEGQLLAYVGSTRGHIEIAVRNSNAAQTLGVEVGDLVRIVRQK